jgi:aconitate hydratase
LPLQYLPGQTRDSLGLSGRESYAIEGVAADLAPGKRLAVTARADDGATTAFEVVCRIDTPVELDYYKHGGILQFVLRQLASAE